MHSYSAYGLGLHSAIPLPELIPSRQMADVEIKFGQVDRIPINDDSIKNYSWISDKGIHLFWKDVATYRVTGGREVTIDAVPGVEEQRIRLFILGAVMSVILHQRGYMVFHASAIEVNGAGVMFVGNKAWGKSTMAAAMHSRGHNCLADDVVGVDDRSGEQVDILPSFPQLKLWPDAISSIGGNPYDFPTVNSLIEKRDRRLASGFCSRRVQLRRIYVLGTSECATPQIYPVNQRDALVLLIANTYNARFGKDIFCKDSGPHLMRCSNLVKKVPVFRLIRPKSLELLPNISHMIEQHSFEEVFN